MEFIEFTHAADDLIGRHKPRIDIMSFMEWPGSRLEGLVVGASPDAS